MSTHRTTQRPVPPKPASPDATAAARPSHVCLRCGACCRWPGYVIVRPDEADAIASYLGITARELLDGYARLTSSRRNLSLIERDDGSCVFLDAQNRCRIHPVKPRQCRDFPERWSVPNLHALCQASACGHAQPQQGATTPL
jgi:hypothetical protein